jgi:hypothetical protein
MIEIVYPDIDWPFIRQTLSLALMKNRPAAIRGGGLFLVRRPEYRPIFEDLRHATGQLMAGDMSDDGTDIKFEPLPVSAGRYRLDTDARSSAVEVLLYLMPSLFGGEFRSVLELSGVTHSVLSYPTSFIKETILGALETIGLYASLTLRRFGFSGSGGGAFESRIYPSEAPAGQAFAGCGDTELTGVKIFISRIDARLAELEKSALIELLGIDRIRIAIIEVMDSDGHGNGIQIFIRCAGITMVLFREMKIFGDAGELIFNEESMRTGIKGLANDAAAFMKAGTVPEPVLRELYPYFIMTGAVPPRGDRSPVIVKTMDACASFFRP